MTPSPRPLYLGAGPDAAFATFHPAAGDGAPDVAVLLCPPFGWDEVCSYRPRRAWAKHLAQQGRPALRLQLPGTGDAAGSPYDPRRVEAWTAAVADAAAWLAQETGAARVAAIGIGLGGLLACRAQRGGAPLDELVLWGVPPKGKALVRELRAFARLEVAEAPDGPRPEPEGTLISGGFALSAETLAALQAVDFTLPSDAPAPRRVLLLGRDGVGTDALRDPFAAAGAQVSEDAGDGYGEMLAKPDDARAPVATFARVDAWLAEGDAAAPAAGAAPAAARRAPEATDELELTAGEALVRERPVQLATAGGALTAVIALPEDADPRDAGLCAVLLNAGAVRRIGPNRLWVEIARRWAARGVPTVRLDFAGIGDADGDDTAWSATEMFYDPTTLAQLIGALDRLQEQGLGDRFVVSGLCSGGYWALQGALADDRVVAALPVNPGALVWDAALIVERDARKLRKLARPHIWRKILRGGFAPRDAWAVVRALLARTLAGATPATHGARVDALLDELAARGKRVDLVLTADEPVRHELERDGQLQRLARWPQTTVELLPGTVRAHTLRPTQLQAAVPALLDRALERELREAAAGRAATR